LDLFNHLFSRVKNGVGIFPVRVTLGFQETLLGNPFGNLGKTPFGATSGGFKLNPVGEEERPPQRRRSLTPLRAHFSKNLLRNFKKGPLFHKLNFCPV